MGVEQHTHGEYAPRTHGHDDYARARDLDGLGKRLNQIDKEQEGIRVKTERNEEDIARVTGLIEKNAEVAASFKDTVQIEVGQMKASLTGLAVKVSLLSAGLSTAIVLAVKYLIK